MMFHQYQQNQYDKYNEAISFFKRTPQCLIDMEIFIHDEILHFIKLHLPEITIDYNEASYLYPFWKNYPPSNRGRSPIGDQIPWIEVGEQVFGNKLLRYLDANFCVKDSGLPCGSDDRCIISSMLIKEKLKITDSVWVFVDIKSAGPRDNSDHVVMSNFQISGSGDWTDLNSGVKNKTITAVGKRVSHKFYASLPPIYVLSDSTIAPLATFVIKPIYDMEYDNNEQLSGQPLKQIKLVSIPNGILLENGPKYLQSFPSLFFPGKDDREKNPEKARARISFEELRKIGSWRVEDINIENNANN